MIHAGMGEGGICLYLENDRWLIRLKQHNTAFVRFSWMKFKNDRSTMCCIKSLNMNLNLSKYDKDCYRIKIFYFYVTSFFSLIVLHFTILPTAIYTIPNYLI